MPKNGWKKINARIAAIDVDLAQAGQSSEKVQELLRRRADFVAEAARTETVWIEALESYEAATTA